MAGMISTSYELLRQHAVVRYTFAIFVVLLLLYLVTLGTQARQGMNADPARLTTETTTPDSLQTAPNEALFESKQPEAVSSPTTQSSTTTDTTVVQAEQSTTSTENDENSSTTTVTINGKNVKPNASGEVHKVIRSGSQNTTVDISSNSQTSSSAESSLDISIESSSSTKSD